MIDACISTFTFHRYHNMILYIYMYCTCIIYLMLHCELISVNISHSKILSSTCLLQHPTRWVSVRLTIWWTQMENNDGIFELELIIVAVTCHSSQSYPRISVCHIWESWIICHCQCIETDQTERQWSGVVWFKSAEESQSEEVCCDNACICQKNMLIFRWRIS